MSELRFTSKNGDGRPQAQARRYVYSILVAMLDSQLNHHPENVEGWMFGGIETEPDRRRVAKAIKAVQADFTKRAALR